MNSRTPSTAPTILADNVVEIAGPPLTRRLPKTQVARGTLQMSVGTSLLQAQRELILATWPTTRATSGWRPVPGHQPENLYNRLGTYDASATSHAG